MNVDTGPKHSAVPQEKSITSYKQVSIDDMITKNKHEEETCDDYNV